MPMNDAERLREVCDRERAALISAARMRTALWATGTAIVGLVAGLYLGRDMTIATLNHLSGYPD